MQLYAGSCYAFFFAYNTYQVGEPIYFFALYSVSPTFDMLTLPSLRCLFVEPFVAFFYSHEEASVFTCHQPQIVVLISGSYAEWVVTAGYLDKVTGLYGVGLIDVALFCVYLLNSEALRLVKLIVVDLLENALGRHVIVVMLVRREG